MMGGGQSKTRTKQRDDQSSDNNEDGDDDDDQSPRFSSTSRKKSRQVRVAPIIGSSQLNGASTGLENGTADGANGAKQVWGRLSQGTAGDAADEEVDRKTESFWWRWRNIHCPYIYTTMEDAQHSKLAFSISIIIFFLIGASSVLFIAESDQDFTSLQGAPEFLLLSEVVFVIMFTLEYSIKIITAKNPWKFFKSPLNMIDLLAILPFWIEQFLAIVSPDSRTSVLGQTRILRILRLTRVFRILKLSRFSSNIKIVIAAISSSLDVLVMLFFNLLILVLVFSSVVFVFEMGTPEWCGCEISNSDCFSNNTCCTYGKAESDAYHTDPVYEACRVGVNGLVDPPELRRPGETGPSPFTSIPVTMWWGMVTATTVGYGDLAPKSLGGQIFGVMLMILGIVFMALPITIVGTNFNEEFSGLEQTRRILKRQEQLPVALKMLGSILQEYSNQYGSFVSEMQDSVQRLESSVKSLSLRSKLPAMMIETQVQAALKSKEACDDLIFFDEELNCHALTTLLDEATQRHMEMKQMKQKLQSCYKEMNETLLVVKKRQMMQKAKDAAVGMAASEDGEKVQGLVLIKIIACQDLVAADISGGSDPYVKIEFGKQAVQTSVRNKCLSPYFDEDLCIACNTKLQKMKVSVWDWDKVGKHDSLGSVDVSLADVRSGRYINGTWRSLRGVKKGKIKFEMSYSFQEEGVEGETNPLSEEASKDGPNLSLTSFTEEVEPPQTEPPQNDNTKA